MTSAPTEHDVETIATEALALLGSGRQVPPFSSRVTGFGLAAAYAVVEAVRRRREARGESPVGRKIGFTNTAVWGGYGISGPIWNYVFDSTVRDLATIDGFDLGGLAEPRIEPEIVLHLAGTPDPGMDDAALFGCIDWVSAGFEIVHSIFPGWSFAAADAAAAFGVHGALLLGAPQRTTDRPETWRAMLSNFAVELVSAEGTTRQGHARNVLGGPLEALRFLLRELAREPRSRPLAAGELVTTGTLTEAMPALPGQAWTARFSGINLEPVQVSFR
jgi:2-oxo-3-hexenedioate decarboxylase